MADKNKNTVAIITMIFLFGMIAFVTNLAAPIGVIWKQQPGIEGSNFLGMMGNMMNFLAYLFMGIPAGKLLSRKGYKTTALLAIAVGFAGVLIQFLSGITFVNSRLFGLPANFFIYLLGAFVSGFCVCMLNTVTNPMLTLLGGGGNKSNQYIQIGGSCNSLVCTVTLHDDGRRRRHSSAYTERHRGCIGLISDQLLASGLRIRIPLLVRLVRFT